MVKEEIYCGLDLGSGRITGVLGKYDYEKDVIEIIAGQQVVDREAISIGVIKDIEKASALISEIIGNLEEIGKSERTKLIVGIRGVFVDTYNTHAQIPITSTDKTITLEDQEKILDHAIKNLRISNDKEIIDIIPQEYIIDGQPGINNPVNMEGNLLEVQAHAVVAYSSFLRNIERTFAEANCIPDVVLYGLIPLSQLITELEERKLGCLVIDFNGQTTSVVAYSNGCIRYSKEFHNNEIDMGSDLITREIAAYYKTSWNIAENIKHQYGVAQPSMVKKDEQIEVPSRDGRNIKIATKKEIARIIAEVLEGLFLDRIIPELKNVSLINTVLQYGDIVITGGGANLHGIANAVKELFNSEYSMLENEVDVRLGNIGFENGIVGDEEIISNFSYITAIALIKNRINSKQRQFCSAKSNKKGIINIVKKIWNFFE